MKQLFFLFTFVLGSAGCMKPVAMSPTTMTPCRNVPKEVTGWLMVNHGFQTAFGDASDYDSEARPFKWDRILIGTHPEIEYLGKGRLHSRTSGWTLNIKYDPYILYENPKLIIIEVVPGLDHLFTSLLQAVYIVDKSTGKIVWKYETSARQGRKIKVYAVVGQTFYFRTYKSKDIYCVNLSFNAM